MQATPSTTGLYTSIEAAVTRAGGTASGPKDAKGLVENLKTATGNLANSFKTVVDNVSLFNDKLINTSKSLGQGVLFAENLQQGFGRVAENILKIGGNVNDVIDLFNSMTKAMDRTVYLSEKTLFNARLLKEVGVDDATMNSFNKLFDSIGGTFEEAGNQQMKLVNQAKSYGLNVSSFMSTVAGQLTKINQYGFPNGVKDISEMVVKSKTLGMNIEAATKFADKIMGSPEEALDVAAKLQTIGGSFASLGDPMELLYLAQNDLSGLNDKLINATRGLAVFNKETGQFEVSVQDRLRIKSVAQDFGASASEIIETSVKLAKQEEIIKRLNFSPNFDNLSEEQKRIIGQYAQLSKGGEITLEGKSLGELQVGEIQNIMKRLQGAGSQLATEGANQEERNIDIIQQNMSTLEKVNTGLAVYENAVSLVGIQTGKFNQYLDGIGSGFAGIVESTGKFKDIFATKVAEVAGSASANIPQIDFGSQIQKVIDAIPKKITLESVAPIKIELTNTANLEKVIQDGMSNYFKNKINESSSTTTEGEVYTSGAPRK